MIYKSYQHVEKLGTSEVEGILNGTVYLFYKIDGTNAVIFLKDDGTIGFGSRKREVTTESDNAKFAATMKADWELEGDLIKFFNDFPHYYIYGEWLVPHALRTYDSAAWNHFYIFDIYNADEEKYLTYEEQMELIKTYLPHFKYIPLLKKLENPTIDQLDAALDETGDFLCTSGLGEGIVIKNYDFVNRYGRRTWAKMLTEDFRNRRKEYRQELKERAAEQNVEYEIVHKLLKVEAIMKEKAKIEEAHEGWSSRLISELLGRVFHEFVRDHLDIILKKWNLPTIDFRKLRSEVTAVVKEFLHL